MGGWEAITVLSYLRNTFYQAYYLFLREMRIRYRRTALNVIWVVIPTMTASFGAVYASRHFNVHGSHTAIYPLKIFFGTMLIQLFTDSFSSAQQISMRCRQFLRFIPFAHESMLVTGVFFALVNFLIKSVFLVVSLFIFGVTPSLLALFYLLPVICLLCLLGISMAAITIPLGYVYWDVRYAHGYIVMAALLATPVLYPVATTGLMGSVHSFNLLTPLILLARDSFLGLPYDPLSCLIVTPGILSFGFLSLVYFHRAMPLGIRHI